MRRLAAMLFIGALLPFVFAQRPATLNGHTFKLPEGYTIEVAARAPLVDRPISAALDEEGRLYVTISSGSNDRGPDQAKKQSHKIVRLTDTDGDGVYDQSTLYAENIAMPQGAMWHAGSLYVAAPPHILKFTDTDGDGKADRREIWFDGKTVTGCMNDLHGPWLGPDGWIYWTKGAFAPQTYTIHGKEWKTRASHVFRARVDGTGIEPLMTGGMDNPVGLAFTSTGDRIVSGTFFTQPAGGKRDGLIHAVYGGIYGKDWDVLHDPQHIWTGPSVLPMMTHLGPAAPCGLVRMESSTFTGDSKHDTLFCCLFNMQKVTRHRLVPKGATYETRDDDFLVSDQKDFHPTDVIEDADGSLLVIDTGGWYKICCPTSQLPRPDVLGAIYRIRPAGGGPKDPYGTTINWSKQPPRQLARYLDDDHLVFYQRRAVAALVASPEKDAIRQAFDAAETTAARRRVLWAAARRGESFASVSNDPDLAPIAMANPTIAPPVKTLDDLPTSLHRQALEAWALSSARGDRQNAPRAAHLLSLATTLATNRDPIVEHSAILALIQAADRSVALTLLLDKSPSVRRAGLIALDQMPGGDLPVEDAIVALNSQDPALRDAAQWIFSRRPDWGKHMARTFIRMLRETHSLASDDFVRRWAKMTESPAIQKVLTDELRDPAAEDNARIVALQVMGNSKLRDVPADWVKALATVLGASQSDNVVIEAARAVRSLKLPKSPELAAPLRNIGTGRGERLTRLTALAAFPDDTGEYFYLVLPELSASRPATHRALAADAVSRSKLDSAKLIELAKAMPSVSPMDLPRLLNAFADSRDSKVGRELLAVLNHPALRSTLRADQVTASLKPFGSDIMKDAEPLVLALNADAARQQSRLDEMLAKMKGGDVARGREVFNNTKNACIACHTFGYLGGKIGPDLTRIGSIRTERDLLEAIVFPSASFVRGYEPVVVQTAAGVTHSGQIIGDAADQLTLATGLNQEVRLSRKEIEEIRPGRVSIMPSGFDQQLSLENLADLIAFLKASR